MAIRGRVGRHTSLGGKQCENRQDDQKTVIDLLNRIPVANGGAGGSLSGSPIMPGVASDALYKAIVQFENKHFPGQRNGFVEPGGAMLKRMEQLAASTTPRAETILDRLRRNVLTEAAFPAPPWVAEDRAGIDKHVKAAVRYIDDLKLRGIEQLPAKLVLFGAAWVTDATVIPSKIYDRDSGGWYTVDSEGRIERPPVIFEVYANPIKLQSFVYADRTGVVLLYGSGRTIRLGPEIWMKTGDNWEVPEPAVVYLFPHQRRLTGRVVK